MIDIAKVNELEGLVADLSRETALAEVGATEGLVPGYHIVGELANLMEADPKGKARAEEIQKVLELRLDDGGAFDEDSLKALYDYVEKSQCFLRYYRMGESISWKELEAHWRGGEGDEEADAEAEETELADDLEDVATDEDATEPASPDAQNASAITEPNDCLLVLDLDENVDVLQEFLQEAQEHLENIEAGLLELEVDPADVDAISSVFRSFHTIKGVAGFLDLRPIRVLAHEVETLLDKVRSHELALNEAIVNLILESRDRLQLFMVQIQAGLENGEQPSKVIPVSDLIRSTLELMDGPGLPTETHGAAAAKTDFSTREVETDFFAVSREETESETPAAAEPAAAASRAEASASDINSDLGEADDPFLRQSEGSDRASRKSPGDRGQATATIRMNTEKLDSIIDAVGELVIVESQLRDSILSSESYSSRIEKNLGQLSRITRELQRSGLSLRMVSLRSLFQKMQRLARDLATKSGKKVVFSVEGEDTEMDRTVVEKIGDPLVHMIRNAMDHGIEPAEERVKAGKPENGQVKLKAFYHGDTIILELSDDGRGISSEKVLKKAIERGVAQPDRHYSREEIIDFLFMAGFSTAEKVSDISGRGVGMDVVRSNVQNLRGRIDMQSIEGQGTTARICLPLTMAIIDGLLIRVGQHRYIIPVMSVNMTVRPRKEQIYSVQGKGTVIKHRDQIFQLVHLGRFFQVPSEAEKPSDGVVVMIDTDRMSYGLIVDEILHKQEVVVKSLGGTQTHGVSGGAILGDGTISLILDPAGLVDDRLSK